MFIVVSPFNPDPMYKQITDQIKNAIASGILESEEKLPSIREMALELKISVITIKRAYSDLENEGYIFTRPGMGSFVTEINRKQLKQDKLREVEGEISKIIQSADKFGITKEDLIAIIKKEKP